jgi:hypothetical protein
MKRWIVLAVLTSLALFVGCFPARAEDVKQYPILSPARCHFGIGTEYVFWDGQDRTQLPTATSKEFAVGLKGTYSMVPHLSATAAALYHVDSRVKQYRVGLVFELFNGLEWAAKQPNGGVAK